MPFAIDTQVIAQFAVLWAVIVPTPGANSLMVLHVAVSRGLRPMALAIAGNMLGIVSLAGAALFGMTAVLEALPWVRFAIELAGAAYLVVFGSRLIVAAGQPAPAAGDQGADPGTPAIGQTWHFVRLGILTALSNAQAIVFVTSIFAVSGVLAANLATGLACIGVMIAMNAAYLGAVGSLFLRPVPRRLYRRFARLVQGAVGVVFVGLGLRLIYRGLARD